MPEANRLQGGNSFRDTARVLKMTRYAVAWMATGCAMGAYEAALKYAQERLQFGKPIGSFQLVQDLLAKMIANITASQCLIVRAGAAACRRQADGRACGARQGVLHGQVPRDRRMGARAAGRQRHRRRLQRRRASLPTAEALYSYEGTYPDAEPDRRQGRSRASAPSCDVADGRHSLPAHHSDRSDQHGSAAATLTPSPAVAPPLRQRQH